MTGIAGWFREPDLAITHETVQLESPASLLSILDSSNCAPLAGQVLTQHLKAKELLVVEIKNNTHQRISDFQMMIDRVQSVSSIALTSTAAAIRTSVGKLEQYDLHNDLLTFPNLHVIPPGSSTRIYIWGTLRSAAVVPRVSATASVESVSVREDRRAGRFAVFLTTHWSTITLLMLVTGVLRIVYLIGLNR